MNLDTTVLEYAVLPGTVFYTRDTMNTSMAILTIGASKTTEDDVTIIAFRVKIPVSNDPKDPNALTSDPTNIGVVSLQPLQWGFQQVDDGVYEAKPIPPVTTVKAGQSITFQLTSIPINESDGTALVTITENAGQGFPKVDKPVMKIKSSLDLKKFDANPVQVQSGAASILSWTTVNAARVTLTPGTYKDLKVNDSVTVYPGVTTTYTLTAYGEGPSISSQRTVQISKPLISRFDSTVSKVDAGDKITLTWNVENATDISISPGDHKGLGLQGSIDVPVWADTTFIISAGNAGNDFATRTWPVGINPVLINSFKANPSYGARLGQPITLSWDMRSAVNAVIEFGATNKVDASLLKTGSLDIVPNTGIAYSLIAQNSLGNTMNSIQLFPMPLGWHQFSSGAPFKFPEPPLVLNYKGNMWAMASNMMNTIYKSFDGSIWIPVTSQPQWPLRSFAAGIVFHDKMWLMGGTASGSAMNDVWSSSDGATWTQETAAAQWPARHSFGCFVLPDVDKIFIVAGKDGSNQGLTDVWSSADGKTWTQETAQAFQNGKSSFAVVTYNKSAWMLGGLSNNAATNEVWYSSDGKSWIMQTNQGARWAARTYPCAAALTDGIYLSGGLDASDKPVYDMNKMAATGKWSGQAGPPWSGSNIKLTGYVEYQNALWFVGGSLTAGANPNVWAYAP